MTLRFGTGLTCASFFDTAPAHTNGEIGRWRCDQTSLLFTIVNSSEQLVAVWQAISATVSGVEIPDADVNAIRLTLTATRFTTSRGGETLFDSAYTTDPTQSPKQIQMIGTGGDFEGQPALGIYAFEEELLKLCYTMPGFARPTDFTSPPGSGAFLITLKRGA